MTQTWTLVCPASVGTQGPEAHDAEVTSGHPITLYGKGFGGVSPGWLPVQEPWSTFVVTVAEIPVAERQVGSKAGNDVHASMRFAMVHGIPLHMPPG
jgi:hypothetical protein